MAIGTALALGAASVASGAMSASASKKAGKATGRAADAATQLQREQYEQTTANYKPYLEAGNDAMAAYLYEMGLGPKPMMGGTRPAIETFTTPTGNPMGTQGPADGLAGVSMRPGERGGGSGSSVRPTRPSAGVTKYRVGGQEFSTLVEAETWADKNPTGATEYGGYTQSPMAKYLMEEGVDSIQGSAAAGGGLYSGAALEALEGNRRTVIGADTSDYFSKLFGTANMGMAAAGNQAGAGSAYANNVGQLQMGAAQAKGNAYMNSANAMTGAIGDIAGIAGYYSNPMAAYAAPTLGFGGGR